MYSCIQLLVFAYRNKQTTPKQFENIVDFMVEHPEMAQGYFKTIAARQKTKHLWEQLVIRLNAEGPPVKDVGGWKKVRNTNLSVICKRRVHNCILQVWADYKMHIKAKLRKEKLNISGTGGGKPSKIVFAILEEKVIEILQLRKTITGTLNTKKFGVVQTTPILINSDTQVDDGPYRTMELRADEANDFIHEEEIDTRPTPQVRRIESFPRPDSDAKHRLLEEQVCAQKSFHQKQNQLLTDLNGNITEMNKWFKRIAREQEKQTDLLKLKIANDAKYELDKSKRHAAKLEIQKIKLQILQNHHT